MTKKVVIENKIIYNPESHYLVNAGFDLAGSVKEGRIFKSGEVIKNPEADKVGEVTSIPYAGKLMVSEGDLVEEGQVISEQKKLLRKVQTVSPVEGKVKKISNLEIQIEEKPVEDKKLIKQVTVPFDGEVTSVGIDKFVMTFPAVELSLFKVKGTSAYGKLVTVESSELRSKEGRAKYSDGRLKDSIIYTDQLTPDIYPLLAAVGAKGIVANSISYSIYEEIIILSVPIGIVTGFGLTQNGKSTHEPEIKPVLSECKDLHKGMASLAGSMVWLDTEYGRLIIPSEKEPSWVSKCVFDLHAVGVVN